MQQSTHLLIAAVLVVSTAAGCNGTANNNSEHTTTGAIGTAGQGDRSGTQTTPSTGQTERNSGGQTTTGASAANTTSTDFAQFAAVSSMAEVEIGRLAQQRAASQDVKQFASRMVTDHTKASMQLQQVAGSPPPPKQLDAKHRDAMQMLQKLNGGEFDREYMRMMVDDHREAVSRFQAEAGSGASATAGSATGSSTSTVGAGNTAASSSGSNAAGSNAGGSSSNSGRPGAGRGFMSLQDFARQTLPVLQEHLQMAQQIQSRLK